MKNPVISIIMPLYNAEKYLEESLKSIQNQTFAEFELICINDASTDNTLGILCDFSRCDSRIKIMTNEEHSGAAYSRNRGMKEAGGKYLSFLDGDDIFEEEMLECAYKVAKQFDTDVIAFEMSHCISEEIYHKRSIFHSNTFVERYCTRPFAVKEQMPYEIMNWKLSPTNKLYKREFVFSNHLEFQDLSCENDVYFVFMAIVLAERMIWLSDNRVMVYARDHFEPTRISYDRDPKCSYLAYLHIAEELVKRGKFAEVFRQFFYQFFFSIRNSLVQCKSKIKAKEYYQFLREEGIDNICSLVGEYYSRADDYIKDLFIQLRKQEFDTQWYLKEQGLLIQLSQQYNADAVRNLFGHCKAADKSVGIWGAGANGISLLNFCRNNGLEIDMVVDKSLAKQGQIINGYLVRSPKEIGRKVNVVIVTPRYIMDNVIQELAGLDIEIIDINQYLAIY